MADNDREYIILDKESLLCRCRGAEYTGCGGADGCKVCFNFKTRAEYEDIIFQLAKNAVTAEGLAKDICARLFGEGE